MGGGRGGVGGGLRGSVTWEALSRVGDYGRWRASLGGGGGAAGQHRLMDPESRIILNVGGIRHETYHHVLKKIPATR